MSSSERITYSLDQMDASVAPPIATSTAFGAAVRSLRNRPGSIQSPEHITVRRVATSSLAASSMSTRAGTVFHTVTPKRRTNSPHTKASRRASSGMVTMDAPQDSGPKMS